MTLTTLQRRVQSCLCSGHANPELADSYIKLLNEKYPEVFQIYVAKFRAYCARIETPLDKWTNACLTDAGAYFKLIDESITQWLQTQSGSQPTVPAQSAAAQQPQDPRPAEHGQPSTELLQDLATLVSGLRSALEKLEPALWKIAKPGDTTAGTSTCEHTKKLSSSGGAE